MISDEYAAGFFDGEGCVNISIRGKAKQAYLRVMVSNTDPNILTLFQAVYGGNLTKPHKHKEEWKPLRQLIFIGKNAIIFLRKIYPFLRLKKAKVELAFEFWEFMQMPKMERCEIVKTPTAKAPYHISVQRKIDTLVREQDFKNQMHVLNKKGA